MNKLIEHMHNENRISLEVAEELLDCYYNRTNKIYSMYNNATFVDKEQLKNLKKMDNFVKDNMVRFTEEVGMQVREVITEIIKKGYYYEGQAEVLNMIANEYNNWKRENR